MYIWMPMFFMSWFPLLKLGGATVRTNNCILHFILKFSCYSIPPGLKQNAKKMLLGKLIETDNQICELLVFFCKNEIVHLYHSPTENILSFKKILLSNFPQGCTMYYLWLECANAKCVHFGVRHFRTWTRWAYLLVLSLWLYLQSKPFPRST